MFQWPQSNQLYLAEFVVPFAALIITDTIDCNLAIGGRKDLQIYTRKGQLKQTLLDSATVAKLYPGIDSSKGLRACARQGKHLFFALETLPF